MPPALSHPTLAPALARIQALAGTGAMDGLTPTQSEQLRVAGESATRAMNAVVAASRDLSPEEAARVLAPAISDRVLPPLWDVEALLMAGLDSAGGTVPPADWPPAAQWLDALEAAADAGVTGPPSPLWDALDAASAELDVYPIPGWKEPQ